MQFEGYRRARIVHQGLYGPVVQAEQEGSGRSVAIQVFTGPFSRPRLAMQAVQTPAGAVPRAISSTALLQVLHAHVQSLQTLGLQDVPAVIDGGALDEEHLYLVHEWMPGQPLSTVEKAAPSPLRCAQRIAACLEAAHRNGIYHLRLRPSQVLLALHRRSQPRVSVLGLGLFTLFGLPQGTLKAQELACLAPELRGSEHEIFLPGAADVYSLAVLARSLLGLPLTGTSDAAVAKALSRGNDGEPLMALLESMSRLDPHQRPSMAEVNGRLFELLARSAGGLLSRLTERVTRGQNGTVTVTATVDRSTGPAGLALRTEAPTHSGVVPTVEQPKSKPPNTDPLLGQVFGNFRLLRRIGSGAMGTVYEAKHQMIEHRAAVKILRSPGREQARRFLDEARAVNIVEHPTLVSVFEFGQRDDGLLYIVMEFLSGRTLDSALSTRKEPYSEPEALSLALQIARALSVAHVRGVIHRDLKPSNIMLVPDPRLPGTEHVKIVDFGIAKLALDRADDDDRTKLGVMLGTPNYMAPEQYGNAGDADGKADVFALGVVLYEALTGVSPFGEGRSFAVVGGPPMALHAKRRGVAKRLSLLVARMLRADPSQRPTMEQVAGELASHVARQDLVRRALPLALTCGGLIFLTLGLVAATRPPGPAQVSRIFHDVRGRASAYLLSALASQNAGPLRAAAARALGETRDPSYAAALTPLSGENDNLVATAAIAALGKLPSQKAGESLLNLMKNGAPERRLAAALAMLEHAVPNIREEGKRYLNERMDATRTDASLKSTRFELATRLYAAGEDRYRDELWRGLEQGDSLRPDLRFAALEQLARREMEPQWALRKLAELMPNLKDRPPRLEVIARLQSLAQREPGMSEQIRLATLEPDSKQIVDLVLLDRDIDSARCERLAQTILDSGKRGPVRKMAAFGISRCGSSRIERLASLLSAPNTDPFLQVEVAGALLQIVGSESSDQYIGLIAAYQDSSLLSDRVMAVRLIEALPEDEGDELLRKSLLDREAAVRRAAAEAISTRRLRTALDSLPLALEGADAVVHENGMRAFLDLLSKLNLKDGARLNGSLKQKLARIIDSQPDQTELPERHRTLQLLARVLLLRDGDTAQLTPLRKVMAGSDEKQRRLLVEVMNAESEIVREALSDPSVRVRFCAARRRAESQMRDSITVLREMLLQEGEMQVIAYWKLRGLGVKAAVPARLSETLRTGFFDVPIRRQVVQSLAVVDAAEAMPLLKRAAGDPAAVVRRAAIRAAMYHYQKKRDTAWLDLIASLAADPELDVRAQAASALRGLGLIAKPVTSVPVVAPSGESQSPSSPEPPSANPVEDVKKPPAGGAPAVDASPVGGTPLPAPAKLMLTGRGDVRISTVAGGQQSTILAAAGTTQTLRPGKYVLNSLCNERTPLDLQPGKSQVYEIHCSPADHWSTGRKMRIARNLTGAAKEFALALRELQGRENLNLYNFIQFDQGEVLSDLGRLKEAMDEWNTVWDRTRNRPLKDIPTIEQKFDRLKSKVGRFTVLEKQGDKCVVSYDQLHMHGARPEAVVHGKAYQPPEGQIRAGVVSRIDRCKKP